MAISERDHYVDPKTGVLKNKFDITDQAMLDQVESSLVAWRSYEMFLDPVEGDFDFKHIKAIHQRLFQDIYTWAGEIRNTDIMVEKSFFAHFPYIDSAGKKIFDELAREKHLTGLNEEAFSERAAYYMGEINALHPFRDGNGRVQREFMRELAAKAGYTLDWSQVSEPEMNRAAVYSFQGDTQALAKIILYNLEKTPEAPVEARRPAMPRRGKSFDF